jgi:aryl-alcohol dehydrogenase-like predicted oxidoreductase
MSVSVARVAQAWQLTRPFVTSVIIGAKSRERLAEFQNRDPRGVQS